MNAGAIQAITRPIVLGGVGGAWTYMIVIGKEVPDIFQMVAVLCILEWVSERAIKRYKEIFKGGTQ
jgi:hypothetical protein